MSGALEVKQTPGVSAADYYGRRDFLMHRIRRLLGKEPTGG